MQGRTFIGGKRGPDPRKRLDPEPFDPFLAPLGLALVRRDETHRRTVYGIANGFGIILAESLEPLSLDDWINSPGWRKR